MLHLFSCPICGGRAEIHGDRFGLSFAVLCEECQESSGIYTTTEEAANAWNDKPYAPTRAPTLRSRIVRLVTKMLRFDVLSV